MTMPGFLTLKHAASTAVTTYQWLSRIGGSSPTEDAGNMAARMILLSLPKDIRNQGGRTHVASVKGQIKRPLTLEWCFFWLGS